MKPTILLIGLGGLGSTLLELLAREPDIGRIVVGGRNVAAMTARCNLERLGALAQGYHPDIRCVHLDLHSISATAAAIDQLTPDLIVSTATLQTWWLTDLLPQPQAAALKHAGFGMWLPVHLALTLKLMEAAREARYAGFTLTAPFPDVINCVLGKLDLAPTCGVGNLDEIVPKVRLLAAERLGTPLEAVRVWLVAHHALGDAAFGAAVDEVPPYFLRVEHGGDDVTAAVQADELLLAPYPITSGPDTHILTAGSTVRLVRALLSQHGAWLHAPAPHGLPGGYPVIASAAGIQLAPIRGFTRDDAIAINERSHRFDGIERIEAACTPRAPASMYCWPTTGRHFGTSGTSPTCCALACALFSPKLERPRLCRTSAQCCRLCSPTNRRSRIIAPTVSTLIGPRTSGLRAICSHRVCI